MNVFSCFDGISCGQQALFNCGIKVDKYYASEINQRAIKVTLNRWPKTIQYGNIKKIKAEHFMSPIHLLMGGSPCQDLSVAGKGAGLSGARSGLFYEFVRLLNELKPTYFFLENVRMKKVYQDEISKILGVEPIYFDSALVSAQTRKRLYWTNIVSAADFVYPDDKGIVLNNILEFGISEDTKSLSIPATYSFAVEKDYLQKRQRQMIKQDAFISVAGKFKPTEKANTIDANYFKGIGSNQSRTCIKVGETENSFESSARVYHPLGKSPAIDTASGGDRGIKVANINVNQSGRGMNGIVHRTDKKSPTLTTNKGEGIKIQLTDTYRKLTNIEVERCFGLPDNYTKGISPSARYHGLGNGWEVSSIMQFFQHLPKDL